MADRRESWGDAAIDRQFDHISKSIEQIGATLQALGSLSTSVSVHQVKIDQHEADIRSARADLLGRLDDLAQVCGEIRDLGRATNGRVTKLEEARIADEAVRKEREATAETQRKNMALRIAAGAWMRPAIVGAVLFVLGAVGQWKLGAK